ncbi:hypothetical protein BKA24_001799 [Microbacterium marinum]|uniref:Uncharacterized protein n=1 Tax=Microbacterium marinum TaxID=421115 RepID=A0A7W7BQQ0_9MICO|nr:hypothetical protein [Microbacterium marinum]MBB4667090.1 hypothetical protein [Microbacterium marinum]
MGTAHANGVWLPGAREPIDWQISPTIMAAAAGNAIAGRSDGTPQPRLFRAANATEADAVKDAGLRPGDQIYRLDTDWVEELGPEGWKVVKTYRAVPYAPYGAYAQHGLGYSPTGDDHAWLYWVDGEQVTIQAHIRWASGAPTLWNSSFPARIYLPEDLPMRYIDQNLGTLGVAHCTIGSNQRMGYVAGVWGSYSDGVDTTGLMYAAVTFIADGEGSAAMAQGSPETWTTNSSFSVRFTYIT